MGHHRSHRDERGFGPRNQRDSEDRRSQDENRYATDSYDQEQGRRHQSWRPADRYQGEFDERSRSFNAGYDEEFDGPQGWGGRSKGPSGYGGDDQPYRYESSPRQSEEYGSSGYGSRGFASGRQEPRNFGTQGYGSRGYSSSGGPGGYGSGGSGSSGYGARGFGGSSQTPGQQGSGTQGYGRQGYGGGQQSRGPQFGDDPSQRYGIGGHRGKGPKGYTRSDERIKEDINEKLWFDDDLDASNIEVEVRNGEVTLAGTVEDRYTKRAAEDLVEGLSGVKHVQNNLRVDSSSSAFTSDRLNENLSTISGSEGSETKARKKASGS